MIQNVNKLKKAQMSKSKTDIIYDPILGHSRKGRDEEHNDGLTHLESG